MPKIPTQWTPVTSQPTNFEPYGAANPTVFTDNDGGGPTNWAPADTKNPTTYTKTPKNPTNWDPTFGIVPITYGDPSIGYADAFVTYAQTQQNFDTPASLATEWSPT